MLRAARPEKLRIAAPPRATGRWLPERGCPAGSYPAPPSPACVGIGFIVNRQLARDKPAFVQRIVSSLVQAMDTFMDNADLRIELEQKYSRLPDAVIAMQERQFVKYDYRTNVADLKAMARELRALDWMKADYSERIDNYIDFTFLAKATGQSPAQLSTW
jgi:NitT/TauT family transport system substrate-binding protein